MSSPKYVISIIVNDNGQQDVLFDSSVSLQECFRVLDGVHRDMARMLVDERGLVNQKQHKPVGSQTVVDFHKRK